jgi:hypothetical protein
VIVKGLDGTTNGLPALTRCWFCNTPVPTPLPERCDHCGLNPRKPEPAPIDSRACPHGDETCPCQDNDICHYEGPDPMYCRLHQTTHIDEKSDA